MGLQHLEDALAPQNERTLDSFMLDADCATCSKAIVKGDSYVVAGNPSVIWKFHLACWKGLPKKFRRGLDVYGGERKLIY